MTLLNGGLNISTNKRIHKSETDFLKELIRKSGFPLEIEISSFLNSAKTSLKLKDPKDMKVSTSAYYLDKDEKKGRQLDIKAQILIEPSATNNRKSITDVMIFLNLLIQCKSIPGNAWVFFRSPQKIAPICDSTSVLDALEWVPREHMSFTFLPNLHFKSVLTTTSYHEFILDKNKSNKRDANLFEAIISLAKATSYEKERDIQDFKYVVESFSNILKYPPNYIFLYYPIIVFDGKMYLVEKIKNEELKLTKTRHVGLFIDYVSGSYDIELFIDIVHKRMFKRFFKTIINDINILRKAIEGSTGIKFRKEVMKALKWCVKKRAMK